MSTPGRTTFHCIDAHTCGNPVRLVYREALAFDVAQGGLERNLSDAGPLGWR